MNKQAIIDKFEADVTALRNALMAEMQELQVEQDKQVERIQKLEDTTMKFTSGCKGRLKYTLHYHGEKNVSFFSRIYWLLTAIPRYLITGSVKF